MRRFGVPRALVSILEGESLVNDATSLVIFEMALTAGNTGQFSLGPAMLSFLWAAGGGIILGLAAGWCIASLRRWIGRTSERSPVLESSISLLTPFVAFLAADRAGVSGVLAVVVAGLYLGHASAHLLTAASRIQAINMWEIVDFLLEGLLFIFVGLGLPLALGAVRVGGEETLSRLIATAAAVSAVVIVLRLAWVFPAAYAPRYIRRRFADRNAPYPPWQNVFFVGWAGLRGAVSLVLALSVPFATSSGVPFPGRDVVIFVTFVVILVTLVGQGLTLRPLISTLGLEPDRAEAFEETNARLQTARAALARLDEIDRKETGLPSEFDAADVRSVVDALRDEYTHRVHLYSNEVRTRSIPPPDPNGEPDVPDDDAVEADLDGRRAGSYRLLRLATLDAERQRLIQMRDGGDISDVVLHRVERDLDLEQALLTGWDR
jgi:monovalent cation/hydrogen antiporter